MKVFTIKDGSLFSFVFGISSKTEAEEKLADLGLEFVEAPDYVFGTWGYDETQEGDERFIRPLPPEGYVYDEKTGDFYEEDLIPIRNREQYEQLVQVKIRRCYTLTDELKVLREALANPNDQEKQQAFQNYNAIVESCKAEAYEEVYGEE